MQNRFELFLTVSVSALLFVLFIAAVDTPEAKRVYCQKNLKKILTAADLYQKDHGQLPPVIVKGKKYHFWNRYLEPAYIKDPKTLACPADVRNDGLFATRKNPLLSEPMRGAMDYGMNYFLTTTFAAKKGKKALLSELTNPSKTYVFGDCKIPWMYPDRYWNQDKTAWHEDESVNMIFADGHVKNLRQRNMGWKDKNGKFVNNLAHWVWN